MYGNTGSSINELSSSMEVGPVDLDATVDFVKSLTSPIDYKSEGRIKRVN